MVNSSRADTNILYRPDVLALSEPCSAQYGVQSVATNHPCHNHLKKPESVEYTNFKPAYRTIDVLKDALRSRYFESVGVANAVFKQSIGWLNRVKKPTGRQYCQQKLARVGDSGRNLKVILCPEVNDGQKKSVFGKKYFPAMLVYSIRNETYNANGRMFADGKKPMCGDLAVLYAKGLYGPGKKGLAQCQSTAQLQKRMAKLGRESWDWAINRTGAPEETHAFHTNDFSLALKTLVKRYWEMPLDQKKVFILQTEQVKDSQTHAMVIMLEKKSESIMVLRHYDPNWTNSCQKVILNHPDHAGHLHLQNLYSNRDLEYFFKNGVAKLASLETVQDKKQSAFYWHDGIAGLRLAAEDGLFYHTRQLADSSEQTDGAASDQRPFPQETVTDLISEVLADSSKTTFEQGAVIEFFLRKFASDSFRENISSLIAGSDLSAGYKLRFLQDSSINYCHKIFSSYPPGSEELHKLDARERKAAIKLAAKHNEQGLAERLFLAVLSDNRCSEEEKRTMYYEVKDKVDAGEAFEMQLRRHVIESGESLDFKSCIFQESHQTGNPPMCQQDEFLTPSHRLQLAIYLNDIKLASDVMDAVLQDGHTTAEDKVKLLALNNASHIGHPLVFDNIEVIERYLEKIMASDLPDNKKAELIGVANGMERRAVCWALASKKTDLALLFARCVANSGFSNQVKGEILAPDNVLATFDLLPTDSSDERVQEIRRIMLQLNIQEGQHDFSETA